jgi:hypothetical protein
MCEHFDLITNPLNLNVRLPKKLYIIFKKLWCMQNATNEYIMKKSRFLQLGLHLGFGIATITCNSMYFYILNANRQVVVVALDNLISYRIPYIRCNSHATMCNFFASNLHIKFPMNKRNVNLASHPFVDGWFLLVPNVTYLQLFYN